jgi:hypothetical protein
MEVDPRAVTLPAAVSALPQPVSSAVRSSQSAAVRFMTVSSFPFSLRKFPRFNKNSGRLFRGVSLREAQNCAIYLLTHLLVVENHV